ncbi:MAG: Rpn family recombination-promoting nuclease/putative transposase [Butyrivibrio sp.]|nr:Rpn family recombination-promoting nuclease/putative transposase [Butyrivibrio sp.]
MMVHVFVLSHPAEFSAGNYSPQNQHKKAEDIMQIEHDNNLKPTYETATGPIEFTLKSDLLFHVVMQQSTSALIGLVCALKGIDPDIVKDIHVENPIEVSALQKETIMDLKLTLNTDEIINIELQTYLDKFWNNRSILYLCRAFDCLKEGENYSQLKPTTHYCITDKNLFPDNGKFFSRYYLMDDMDYQIYSENFSIGVVQLQYTDVATKEDEDNGLVFWAELFNASTWEEFKTLAAGNSAIEEVGNLMLQMNVDDETREALEAQRKYREQFASQYTAGYTDAEEKLMPIIAEKDEALAKKDEALAQKDETISKLLSKLSLHGISLDEDQV